MGDIIHQGGQYLEGTIFTITTQIPLPPYRHSLLLDTVRLSFGDSFTRWDGLTEIGSNAPCPRALRFNTY